MPPRKAMSSSGRDPWRRTTNFWWCDPAGPHPHVEQALTAGVVDLVAQPPVFRCGERQTVPVGAPDEPAYVDAAPGSGREHLPDLRVRGTGEALVGVSAPVDEHQQVTIAHLRPPPVQLREVRRAVDEGPDHVALGPRRATEMAGVQSARGVSAFLRGQEPPRQEPLRPGHIQSLPGAGRLSRGSLRLSLVEGVLGLLAGLLDR